MGRKKKKKNMYFDMDVQDAIIRYNSLDQTKDQEKRNKIYQNEIHPAFDKLCENIINAFKFSYFDDVFVDVKHEVVAFLVMNMHKYDHTKGSKAFSYFSIVAKNYLILHNNANYKKYKTHSDISVLNKRPTDGDRFKQDFNDLTEEVIRYFDNNIPTIFKSERDTNIAYAILELLKQREEIENFNKKALYILIREMTNVNTSKITAVVNVFKKHYKIILNQYQSPQQTHNKINKFFQ